MAWGFVQSAITPTAPTTGTTVSVTMGSNCSAGTTLIAAAGVVTPSGGTQSFTGVSDGTNSWILVQQSFFDNTNTVGALGLWVLNTPTGDVGTKPTITATFTTALASGATAFIIVEEISGLAQGNTLAALVDGSAGTLNGTSSGTGSTGGPAYSSTAANEYLLTVFGDDGVEATMVQPSGFTLDTSNSNDSSQNDLLCAYKNSTGGSESSPWDISAIGDPPSDWSIITVAFLLPGAAPVSGPQVNRQLPNFPAYQVFSAGPSGKGHSI